MLRIISIFVVLAISLPVKSAETGELVLLEYAAEPGVAYVEEVEGEIIKVKNGIESVERSISAKTRIQLVEHPEGMLARSNLIYYSVETEDSDLKQYMDPFYEKLQPVSMSVVISDSGEFIKLEGVQAILESTRDSVDNIIEKSPDELKAMLSLLADTWLTEEAIIAQLKQNWVLEVQQWVGAEFEKGYEYEVAYLEEVPEFANARLAFDGEYEYLGNVSCNEGDEDTSCVELYFQSSLKPESAKALTDVFAANQNLAIDATNLVALDMKLKLITEQSTLRAHQYEKMKTIWMPDDDGLSWTEYIEKMTLKYSYD